jgi:hypothetical protein
VQPGGDDARQSKGEFPIQGDVHPVGVAFLYGDRSDSSLRHNTNSRDPALQATAVGTLAQNLIDNEPDRFGSMQDECMSAGGPTVHLKVHPIRIVCSFQRSCQTRFHNTGCRPAPVGRRCPSIRYRLSRSCLLSATSQAPWPKIKRSSQINYNIISNSNGGLIFRSI